MKTTITLPHSFLESFCLSAEKFTKTSDYIYFSKGSGALHLVFTSERASVPPTWLLPSGLDPENHLIAHHDAAAARELGAEGLR